MPKCPLTKLYIEASKSVLESGVSELALPNNRKTGLHSRKATAELSAHWWVGKRKTKTANGFRATADLQHMGCKGGSGQKCTSSLWVRPGSLYGHIGSK